MKKVLKTCGKWALMAIGILFLFVFAIGLLFYLPVDYILYKTSRYGREVRERYSPLMGISEDVKLYNGIRKAELPIDYANGHFVYGSTLFLYVYGPVSYRQETGEWVIYEEEDRETTFAAYAELSQLPACGRVVFLVDQESIHDEKDLQEAKRCNDMLLYAAHGKNDIVRALRAFIEAGA